MNFSYKKDPENIEQNPNQKLGTTMTMFLQKLQQTRNPLRLQASLPCLKRSGFKNRNCPIMQSALLAACCPSRPLMPTPTWAVVIMFTSFAPSPIERVTLSGNLSLTTCTMSAFYLGETLQAKTTSTTTPISRNQVLRSALSIMYRSDSPLTIRATFCFSAFSLRTLLPSSSSSLMSSSLFLITNIYSISLSRRPDE